MAAFDKQHCVVRHKDLLMNGIIAYTAEQINEHRQASTSLLQLIVNHGASIGWLAPLSRDDALEYWATVREQVA